MKKLFNSRKFRQGSVATAITVIVVALIVVFNMVIGALSDRYPLAVDLTENKLFGISDESKTFLKTLNKDITIYVLSTEESFIAASSYAVQANEVIKRYTQESPHVKVEYIDLLRNPAFESQYPDLQLHSNSILVTCGNKVRDLTPYDLYNVQSYQGQTTIASSKAEQAMTSAMPNVTSDKTVDVTFITGHNETALSGLESLLELNNYTTSSKNLLTEDLDPASKIAVLAAPQRDLTEQELTRLDDYLSNGEQYGTTLVYLASVEQPEPTEFKNLSAFLRDWGVEVRPSVVFETSLNRVAALGGTFNMYAPYVDYAEDTYSEATSSKSLMVLVPFSRPLSILFESKSSITTIPLLQFTQTSGVLPEGAPSDWQPKESDLSGPIPALVLSQKTTYSGMTALRSNVVVCASSFAVADEYLSATSIGNGDYFLNLLNKLAEREDVVNIQAKEISVRELGIGSAQALSLSLLFVIILPLAVLVYGTVIWLRRRHR